jgi:hypothetical protein
MRWAGHVTQRREKMNSFRTLVGKAEVRRPKERPRHRWVDDIKMDLRVV